MVMKGRTLYNVVSRIVKGHGCLICQEELKEINEKIQEGKSVTVKIEPDYNAADVVTHWHITREANN